MKTTTTEHFAAADFSKNTRTALKSRGMVVTGETFVAGERAYEVAHKGVLKVLTFAQVETAAA